MIEKKKNFTKGFLQEQPKLGHNSNSSSPTLKTVNHLNESR
jgi:hypothetical protein